MSWHESDPRRAANAATAKEAAMSEEKGRPRPLVPFDVGAGRCDGGDPRSSTELTTDDLLHAVELALETNETVHVHGPDGCVNVSPDVVVVELSLKGVSIPRWPQVHSLRFPSRVAYLHGPTARCQEWRRQ